MLEAQVVTLDTRTRATTACLLNAPRARSLQPLKERQAFTPTLGASAAPGRLLGSKSKSLSRRPKSRLYYAPPGDIAEWQPIGGGPGVMDCWPLRVPGKNSSTSVKPKLLQGLLDFREQELARLAKSGSGDNSEVRLQISRECLESFCRNFKTYDALLADIKQDYETVLENHARRAAKVGPLEAELNALQNKFDLTVAELERKHEGRTGAQEASIKNYQRKVMHLESQVEHSRQYKEECERQMEEIEGQLNHLQVTLSFNAQQALHVKSVNQTMESELQQTQSMLTKAQKAQSKMNKEMRGMVPREKLESAESARADAHQALQLAQEQAASLQSANAQLQQAYDTMSAEHGAIKAMYLKVVGSLELPNELNVEASSLTPRPRWPSVADMIGLDDCASLGASSEQRARQLAEKLKKAETELKTLRLRVANQSAFFEPLGSAACVPVYLRSEKPVKNLHWSQEDVEETVSEMWSEKGEKFNEETMDEYVAVYLKKNFMSDERRAQFMYNLWNGLAKFGASCMQLGALLDVLEGKAEESVFWSCTAVAQRVASGAADRRDAMGRDVLALEDVCESTSGAVRSVCRVKSTKDLLALGHALLDDIKDLGGWDELTPNHLAGLEREKLMFTSVLRSQTLKERLQFVREIQLHLEKVLFPSGEQPVVAKSTGTWFNAERKSNKEQRTTQTWVWEGAQVTKAVFKEVVSKVDPAAPAINLENLSQVVFGEEDSVAEYGKVHAALLKVPLFRHSLGR